MAATPKNWGTGVWATGVWADGVWLTAYSVSGDAGSYVVTGADASLRWGHVLSSDAAAYGVTGSASTPEFGRVPTSDLSTGAWTPSTGTDLYAMLDDAADGTYIRSSTGASSDTCEVAFPAMNAPGAGTVTIYVRHRATP